MLMKLIILLSYIRLFSIAFISRSSRLTFSKNIRLRLLTNVEKSPIRRQKRTNMRVEEVDGSGVGVETSGHKYILPVVAASLALMMVGASHYVDVGSLLDNVVNRIDNLGPYGYIYFAMAYVLAEVLAVPALPLTASSGYLFGLLPGTLIVLLSATTAASISFFIGRTFLRGWAESYIANNPKWKAIDKAIGNEGFRVVLLLRLSPLLPFALSNYLYAITSVDFASFIAATVLGFAPGTFALVYFGTAGKALLADGGAATAHIPWYAYAGAGMLLLVAAQTVSKVASRILSSIEDESRTDT